MSESELKDGLVKLGEFLKKVDIDSELLEVSPEVPMDSLHIPMDMDGLQMDLVCNYMESSAEEEGILQFFAQVELGDGPDVPKPVTDETELLRLCNGLNSIIPVGQMVYLNGDGREGMARALGLRYTMLTDLDNETELSRCVDVIVMLMTAYQLLCGTLVLMSDGYGAAEAIAQAEEVL